MAKKAENKQKITALYCRLSVEDIKDDDKNSKKKGNTDESNSITNQRRTRFESVFNLWAISR